MMAIAMPRTIHALVDHNMHRTWEDPAPLVGIGSHGSRTRKVRHAIGHVQGMTSEAYNERLQQALERSTRRTLRRMWITLTVMVGGWGVLIAVFA